MSPEFAYFLKVNVAFALFYAFYRLFFYKDTFFKLRRTILLAFFALALIYPLFNIQDWLKAQEPMAEVILIYSSMITPAATPASGEVVTAFAWKDLLHIGLWFAYGALALFFIVRFTTQLISILWLAHKSKKELLQGTPVHRLRKPAGPFSFFKLIFIHPESHTEPELDEILTHEKTHVGQWHSLDVIFSELVAIVCWFNPFVWLLKREVRHNLEYLADNRVLESGYDSRSYQYHLLGLAHHSHSAHLYNSFNVLHLKNRIGMMNKKRSKGINRTKYLTFIPLLGALMVLSNIEALARIAQDVGHALPPSAPLVVEEATAEEQINEQIFAVVEQMPQFPQGDAALVTFINNNLHYPKDAVEKEVDGRVMVSFIVGSDGMVRNPEVVSGIFPSLDAEAIRVVSEMPKWEPGRQRGKAVNVKYTIPIQFRLAEKERGEAVFTVVEKMPHYPAGDAALLKFIGNSIKYPIIAQENGIQGRVVVSFVVEKDGSIVDAEVVRGQDPSLDREALRVVTSMPKWVPGEQRGKPVRVKYTMPIQFRLQ
ncbi:TonB family protein [Parabacteroides sp. PFB2-10]|uniref:M56 family metallopeptidase n=1 Tax=Parabacteroides sp. PFB2-10 TaxID=1742405 RepID=UPI002474DC31|nr:M56 family metallopeptidase [Parabacteroides sp. PFB2-10]MDH6311584.1 TonB family protein [Parabacteroides sp. PFB2-10]